MHTTFRPVRKRLKKKYSFTKIPYLRHSFKSFFRCIVTGFIRKTSFKELAHYPKVQSELHTQKKSCVETLCYSTTDDGRRPPGKKFFRPKQSNRSVGGCHSIRKHLPPQKRVNFAVHQKCTHVCVCRCVLYVLLPLCRSNPIGRSKSDPPLVSLLL